MRAFVDAKRRGRRDRHDSRRRARRRRHRSALRRVRPARRCVFVHGVGSTAAIWDAQLEAFGDDVSLRGDRAARQRRARARSRSGVDYPRGIRRRRARRRRRVRLDRFTLVGCSLGGVVAFELWKRVPQRIDAMVMVGSFARYPNAQAYADGVEAAPVRSRRHACVCRNARARKLGLPPARCTKRSSRWRASRCRVISPRTQATWTAITATFCRRSTCRCRCSAASTTRWRRASSRKRSSHGIPHARSLSCRRRRPRCQRGQSARVQRAAAVVLNDLNGAVRERRTR